MRTKVSKAAIFGLLWAAACVAYGQSATPELSSDMRSKIEAAITTVVTKTGVPSASVGIVQDGRIVYTQAFGDARLKAGPQAGMKATAAMSYPVGSISKQFTATCLLLLAEDGKLTLDDPVSRWFPRLTRANEVTVRELLSHTSGYEDYAPQDYTIPAWMTPTDPAKVVAEWAGKPLDFEPGTQWQYSNTNFVLAALIVEKASGMKYIDFLRQRVFKPLGLTAVLDLDTQRDRVEPLGYERHALAPLRTAVLEAPGWYFGDGSLAMPVAELLRWDIAIMDRKLLKPASYDTFETATKLKDGKDTRYSLGVTVMNRNGKKLLEHSGEVGGFVSENLVALDDRIAIAVLTNQEASGAASEIAGALAKLLLPKAAPAIKPELPEEGQVRRTLAGLEEGKLDRGQFTADANFYFSTETVEEFRSSLKPLGAVIKVTKQSESLRGGMTFRSFSAEFASGTSVSISTYTMSDGKLEQFLVEGKD